MRYADRVPITRPAGLRLTAAGEQWFRIDTASPASWSWRPFATARYRFDSPTGRVRVRYAGDAARVALRERFDESQRLVGRADLDLRVVELTGRLAVLDLRRDATLDALGLDDQINTSRAPGVWAASQLLADRVHDWFGARCHGIVYRSRTTPQRSANLAFFVHAPLLATDLGPLREQTPLLASCVVSDGFAVEGWR